jgi:glycosyltransferase involved in cell wall biosynthesis
VKVLEALTAGKAVVSTSVGVQGLGAVVDAGGIAVHDDAPHFAAAIVDLLEHPDRRTDLGARGQVAIRGYPDWDAAAARLLDCYARLLATPRELRPAPALTG